MKKLFVLLIALFASTAFAGGNLGDYAPSAVIYGKFTTYRPSTGAAYTLGGTPALSVYKDNSTTQSTTGVTLTADFDTVTGLNHFAIDTSADGTFYSAGSNFDVVITTGTVDSVSVVGTVVASFTIRKGTVTGIPNATAGASGGLMISGSNSGATTLAALTVTGTTTLSNGLVVARSSANSPAATFTGNGTGNGITITSGSGATGTGLAVSSSATNGTAATFSGAGTGNGVTATGGATGGGLSLVGGATSGNALQTAYTSPVGAIKGFGIIESGTLQSATSTTAVLRSATSFADSLPVGATLVITGGTGAGQSRAITGWVNSTDTATVATWTTTPDNTSTYEVWGTSAGSSGSVSIAAGGITASSFAAGAIDAAAIAADAIGASEIADNAIDAASAAADFSTEVAAAVTTAQGILTGTCDSGSTTTCVDNALTQADATQLQDRLICFDDAWCALITTFTPGTDTATTTKTAPSTRASKAYTIFPSTLQ